MPNNLITFKVVISFIGRKTTYERDCYADGVKDIEPVARVVIRQIQGWEEYKSQMIDTVNIVVDIRELYKIR